MKKWMWLALVCLAALAVAGWGRSRLPSPDTNLEFWIAEHVDDVDFSGYQEKYGLMGGREYYGKGYTPSTGSNGEQKDPQACVIYTVTAYPDYSSRHRHITRITITDPSIEFYGLTLHSSAEDVDAAMRQHGFRPVQRAHATGQIYSKGKYVFLFSNDVISLSVKVHNLLRIQF